MGETKKNLGGRPKMLSFYTECGFTELQRKFLMRKLKERGEGAGMPSVIRDAVDRWRIGESEIKRPGVR